MQKDIILASLSGNTSKFLTRSINFEIKKFPLFVKIHDVNYQRDILHIFFTKLIT